MITLEDTDASQIASALIQARRAAGSVRDSMSLLDQALALGGDTLTAGVTREVLGLAGQELFSCLFEALAGRDCPTVAELYARLPEKVPADTSKQVLSPMPGLVFSLDVVPGQEVKMGEVVAVIEAMKMENILKAERDGVVKAVGIKVGDSVAADQMLVEFE